MLIYVYCKNKILHLKHVQLRDKCYYSFKLRFYCSIIL